MTTKNFKARVGIQAPLVAAEDGTTALTLANSTGDVTVAGDLTVTGNNIKSSSATSLTLSGADVTVAGNLAVNGTTLTLDADNAGAGNDISIVANRGSSGTDASLTWTESSDFWVFTNDVFAAGQIVGGTSIATNGNDIFFNNEDGAAADAFITVKRPSTGDAIVKWNETTDRWQTSVDASTYLNIPNQNLDTTDSPTFAGATLGNVTVGVATDNTISTTSSDLEITATGSNAVNITSGTTEPTRITRNTAETNTAVRSLALSVQSSGTPTAGFGNSLEYEVETAPGNTERAGFISVTSTDVTAASEDFSMSFGLMTGGATADTKMSLNNAGDLQIDGDLTVTGNDIKSSSATALTLSGADVTVAGGLTVTGNDIKSSTATALTLSGANVTVADDLTVTGDLTVTSNLIKSSTGATAFTLSGANVAVMGDLTVTDNDIKSSTATALTLSGADVTVAGDLAINGTTLTLDANNAGAGADLSIIANRGSSGTDATLVWSESTGFWTFNKDLYVSEQIIGGSTLGLNGNTINFNNEDGATLADCFINVKKPGVGDPQIKWNETTDRWQTTVDSSTYINIPDQNLETTSDVAFGSVNANITDANYVLGQLVYTPTTAYAPPTSALTTVTGTNGIAVASSTGNNANIGVRYSSGDTTSGTASAASLILAGTSGTSTAPGGNAANQVMGNINIDGYTAGTSNNFASQIATMNQGAGTAAINPLQMQGYARQAFTNSTTTATTVTGASGTGSVATITFTTQNTAPYVVGQTVAIAGIVPAGYNDAAAVITVATTSSISYANTTSTSYTSGGTITAVNTVTAAGMGFRVRGFASSTNMTVANRFNFIDLTASAATFKSNAYTFANEVITGSTLTATNYMTLGATTGSVNQDTFTVKNTAGTSTYASFVAGGATITGTGLSQITRTTVGTPGVAESRPSFNIQLSRSDQAAPNDSDATGFRYRLNGSNATNYTVADMSARYRTAGDTEWTLQLANGDQTGATFTGLTTLLSKITATTISAGTASGTTGASAVATVAVFSPTGVAVTGNITATGTIGYTTGAGGTVTQATSRTTGVTLNKSTGAITLFSDAGTTTATTFTVTNSTVAATDVIILNQKSGTDLYDLMVTAVAGGSFNITFRTTGGTTTEQPVFNFAVIKGIAA